MKGRFWQRASYRTAATTALILALAAFLLGGGTLLLIRAQVTGALDERISGTSDPIVALARSGDEQSARAAVVAASAPRSDQLAITLFDRQGRRVLGEPRMPNAAAGWANITIYDSVEGDDPVRVLATDLPNGERLIVAGNRRPIETADDVIRWIWMIAAATILLLSTSLAVLLGRHLDRRLSPIVRTADAVIAGDLTHRVTVSMRGDEFDRVAESLNTMLDRISGLMANLRGIAGDIAHDLRTPLGRLRARLEMANADPAKTGTREEVIEDSVAAIDKILALFEAVLRIGEIEEGGAQAQSERIDLDRLVSDIAEAMQPVFEEAGLILTYEIGSGATILGDRDQLATAIINVLENALRHTSMGSKVALTVSEESGHCELVVTDTGPGVPEEDLERIFDRFVRLDAARTTPGHGLGLSLVRAVVAAHNGTVTASNGPLCFSISFRFPRCSS